MITRREAIGGASAFTFAALAAGCAPKAAGGVGVGAILSLSGAAAPYGEDNRRGLLLALDAINGGGGVLGNPLRLDLQDSAGDNAQAVTLARRFAGDKSILAIVGPTRTGETVAVAGLLPQLEIPMMSVGSTGDWRSAAGEFNAWTFRSTRVDTYLVAPLLTAARDRFGVRTVGIISTSNDDYAVSVLPVYKAAIRDLGLSLVAETTQLTGDTDRAAQLTAIRAKAPDALIINTLSSDAPSIAAQARKLGVKSRFIGTAGFSNPQTWTLANPGELDGTLTADNFFSGSTGPAVADFVRRYRAKYGAEPAAYAAYAYDGLRIVADAIRRAGPGATRSSVRAALASTTNFEGVLGRLTYKGSGDAEKPAVLLQIEQGRYQLIR